MVTRTRVLGGLEGLVHGVWKGVAVGHVGVWRNEWLLTTAPCGVRMAAH